jgi:hypothetical protein
LEEKFVKKKFINVVNHILERIPMLCGRIQLDSLDILCPILNINEKIQEEN